MTQCDAMWRNVDIFSLYLSFFSIYERVEDSLLVAVYGAKLTALLLEIQAFEDVPRIFGSSAVRTSNHAYTNCSKQKGKGKAHPRTGHEGPEGE